MGGGGIKENFTTFTGSDIEGKQNVLYTDAGH